MVSTPDLTNYQHTLQNLLERLCYSHINAHDFEMGCPTSFKGMMAKCSPSFITHSIVSNERTVLMHCIDAQVTYWNASMLHLEVLRSHNMSKSMKPILHYRYNPWSKNFCASLHWFSKCRMQIVVKIIVRVLSSCLSALCDDIRFVNPTRFPLLHMSWHSRCDRILIGMLN